MLKRNISVLNLICLSLCAVLVLASCGKKGTPVPIAVVKAGIIADLRRK